LLIFLSGVNSKVPNVVAQRTSQVRVLDPEVVPSVDEAVQMYLHAGGTITPESTFGVDPLANYDNLIRRREQLFSQNIGSFTNIFNNVISGDGTLMETALFFFFNTTVNLSPLGLAI
jgi:hypothetical protein